MDKQYFIVKIKIYDEITKINNYDGEFIITLDEAKETVKNKSKNFSIYKITNADD